MQLIPLFEGELIFDESTEVGFPTTGKDGDWCAYVCGTGTISGERIGGQLRWTNRPRRRADGAWLPEFDGVIATEDEAKLLFSFSGYNQGRTDPFEFEHRSALGALTLMSGDERYRWVNSVFAVIEADVRPSADPEHWTIRAFECINDIINNTQVKTATK